MKKYCFSVDGISVAIFTDASDDFVRDKILPTLSEGELAAVLSYGSECDFHVQRVDKDDNEPREPSLLLVALSCLFKRVYGYPSMTLDISYGARKYEINIGKGAEGDFSVNGGKCKILYTKTVNFNDGVSVDAEIVASDNLIGAVLCEDSELFDDGRLDLLFESLRPIGVSAALAISYGDFLSVKKAGDIPFYEAVRVGLAALSSRGVTFRPREQEARVNGRVHKFSLTPREIVFHSEIKYIS